MRTLVRALATALILLCTASATFAAGTMARVIRIVDGSTIAVDIRGKENNIHVHGVATPDPKDPSPELQKLGTEAAAYLGEYLKEGWVYLEYPSGQPVPDADGVIPAFVYRGSDATFVNREMVLHGLGVVNRKVESSFRDDLLDAEKRAKGTGAGVWGAFADGGGKAVASGTRHQGNYLGESANRGMSTNVVYYWIIRFR